MALWLHKEKLILASSSATRQKLLQNTSIPFDTVVANIDERAIERQAIDQKPSEIALLLAKLKTRAVSVQFPNQIVVGADQMLEIEGQCFYKPNNIDEARIQIESLANFTHILHSAVSISENGKIIDSFVETAFMTVRSMTKDKIEAYFSSINDKEILKSVGAYRFEETGIRLFSEIAASYTTILGLPIIPLLKSLSLMGHYRA